MLVIFILNPRIIFLDWELACADSYLCFINPPCSKEHKSMKHLVFKCTRDADRCENITDLILPQTSFRRENDVYELNMMTSSYGNIFSVTNHLCEECTGHRWIPRTKASDAELWCFLWSVPAWRLTKQSWGWWFERRLLWRYINDWLNIFILSFLTKYIKTSTTIRHIYPSTISCKIAVKWNKSDNKRLYRTKTMPFKWVTHDDAWDEVHHQVKV